MDTVLIALGLCSFTLTLFTWLRLFGWLHSLLAAGETEAAKQPTWLRIGTGNLSGLFKIATQRGRSQQWFGLLKAFFWAALSFTLAMMAFSLLTLPNKNECGINPDILQTSLSARIKCLWQKNVGP
ncbi:hypothetical protein [Sulfitobacter sp.]|uniref:hypothetical protein n=1 Tax=Sulfitobacter sp. TaxID=1903071 RepID=UPI0030011290